jgi:hypothetical protein
LLKLAGFNAPMIGWFQAPTDIANQDLKNHPFRKNTSNLNKTLKNTAKTQCGKQDLNLHGVATTRPSIKFLPFLATRSVLLK